ncbi:MAG: MOSC domain-containing protein [Actinobacteria bacterium]|nr:MOSC domain-containing protein [Actinomycetota bacterium]MBU1944738.1 MOSC domain-containing protein [Actinomycetota bacterium]MBU2688419.1 MOSC domain-containing protein [Actinomycetota bacterium]
MEDTGATVVSVNISEATGEKKHDVGTCELLEEHGLRGDAHARDWHRQVSLLALESIDKMRDAGLDVSPGDFAENLTIEGLDVKSLPVGTRLSVGGGVLLEITQIGKECHERCAIYYQAGDCVMPREGVFARVLEGGKVSVGDKVVVVA